MLSLAITKFSILFTYMSSYKHINLIMIFNVYLGEWVIGSEFSQEMGGLKFPVENFVFRNFWGNFFFYKGNFHREIFQWGNYLSEVFLVLSKWYMHNICMSPVLVKFDLYQSSSFWSIYKVEQYKLDILQYNVA